MGEIYDTLVSMIKSRLEKEKETTLSEDTYRMISLAKEIRVNLCTYDF